MAATVDDRIWQVLADASGYEREDMKDSDKLVDDLGMDSLDLVSLELALEDTLGIEVEWDDMVGANTVGELVKLLRQRAGQSAAG